MRYIQLKKEKQSKLHYKLHKVGKNWVTMSLLGMALGVGELISNNISAHADTTQNTTATQNTNQSTQPSSSSSSETKATTIVSATTSASIPLLKLLNNANQKGEPLRFAFLYIISIGLLIIY